MKGKTGLSAERADGGLRPWHLLLLGGLAAATAGAVVTGGTDPANSVLIVLAIASAALVAMGVFRTLAPFFGTETDEPSEMRAGRTRAALEREKLLVLRSIKEVESDRAMQKISEADFQEMAARLRQRAARLMRELDGDGGYRALIERDLARLVGRGPAGTTLRPPGGSIQAAPPVACASCQTTNDSDARFCKACGTALARRST